MNDKLIIFLICKRLGLKKFQLFQFCNQKDKNEYYYFSDTRLMKGTGFYHDVVELDPTTKRVKGKTNAYLKLYRSHESHVRFNFLIGDEIKKTLVRY